MYLKAASNARACNDIRKFQTGHPPIFLIDFLKIIPNVMQCIFVRFASFKSSWQRIGMYVIPE